MILLEDNGGGKAEIKRVKTKKEFSLFSKKADGDKLNNVRIKLAKVTIFVKQLASMLKAGLPLSHAIDTIANEMEDRAFKGVLIQIKEKIFSGTSFSEAIKAYPRAFPSLFLSMVEAGEVSGSLPDAMDTVALYFEASLALTKKVKSALTYPIAMISMSFLLVSALMIWVVPVFSEMFSGFGASLPLPTQILIDVSNLLKNNLLLLLATGIVLVYGSKVFLGTARGREFLDAFLRYVPLFGMLIRKTNIARFCKTYSVLLSSGVPIIRAIEICTNVANSFYLNVACTKIKKGIQEGRQLSSIMEGIDYFPKIVSNMTKAGEQSGNVEEMIKSVATLYENDVNNIVTALTSLIEPALVCFMGVVIGGIVIAMFMPIFQLSSLVSG